MKDSRNNRKSIASSTELESVRKRAEAAISETEALRKAVVTLADDPRMDFLLDRLLGSLRDVVPFDSASVLFAGQEESPRLFVARESPPSPQPRRLVTVDIDANPFVHRVFVERKSVLLADVEEESGWRPIKAVTKTRCWIGVPFVMHDSVLGILSIGGRTPGIFTREHLRLAKLLAIPMTVSIHRAQLYEWAAIYAAERMQLLRKVGPVPGPLLAGDPPLPN